MNTPTNINVPAAELDSASLDQVVGGAKVVVHEVTDTADARKQEQSDKLTSVDAA